MYENSNFYNSLLAVTKSELLQKLNFNYRTVDDFNNMSSSVKNMEISVFHLNIQSLNKNHVNLFTFLQLLNIQFDVIVLSEIWNYNLNFCHTLFKDYTFYYDTPPVSKVGGVGVFVNNVWNCNVINNEYKLALHDEVAVESVWLEITKSVGKRQSKYIVGGIYRHPNSNINLFTDLLENTLCKIRQTSTACVIAGDINTDFSKYSDHVCTTNYVDTLLASNFLPVIVMPSRITSTSASVIDLCITSKERM